MSDTEHSVPVERRQACDNCKVRKTKCDKKSPCASCITLKVACRTTKRTVEKRQRVLLSSKYDEAVQEISRQLVDVKQTLQALVSKNELVPHRNGPVSERTPKTPRSLIDEHVPSLLNVHEGYRGKSSFQSHVQQVDDALEATIAAAQVVNADATTTLTPNNVHELLHHRQTADEATSDDAHGQTHRLSDDFELEKKPLPPLDFVLKLLRLIKADKQRFFVDVPFFSEDEFIDMCRNVYFAMDPISLWTWISVNIGLYYLLFDVNEENRGRMDTTEEAMHSYRTMLVANAEAAMKILRLCSEPSLESCRALALLGTFYIKEGHSTIAWRIMSGAARACLDLGFNRLPGDAMNQDVPKKRSVFWYIYSWDKGLAMTCGRTPVIHHYDVATARPTSVQADGNAMRLFDAFVDCAIVTGEIQQNLFSASAEHASQQVRIQHVRSFATRLVGIQDSIRHINDGLNEMLSYTSKIIDIMLWSLLTVVYRVLPPTAIPFHPLQCSDECVDSARNALSALVTLGERLLPLNLTAWRTLLNLVLSLVPFVSFIVLAGNAIATSSGVDLALLDKVVVVLGSIIADSPVVEKMHDACSRLGRIASVIVSSSVGDSYCAGIYPEQASSPDMPLHSSLDGSTIPNPPVSFLTECGFPMAQQDWNNVMLDFESELGRYDSRTLTNIIEPYIANTGW